jgi:hypothetical protein
MRIAAIVALVVLFSLGVTAKSFAADTPYAVILKGNVAELNVLRQSSAIAGARFKVIRLSAREVSGRELRFVFNWRKLPAAGAAVIRNGITAHDQQIPTLLQGFVRYNRGGFSAQKAPAALSIIKDKIRIQFMIPQKRGPRLYSITARLNKRNEMRARLSRTRSSMFLGKECGSTAQRSAKEMRFNALLGSISANEATPQRVVTISTDADPEWYARYGDAGNAEIAAIVNAAEAIFERQLGVRLSLVKQHMYTDSISSPYTALNASALLRSFARNPDNAGNLGINQSTFLDDIDVKYLFTDKDLEGNTIGVSYLGALCWSTKDAYGVVQNTRADINPATFAHELGHTFGASHDTTDPQSIMYPTLGAKSYFSPASVGEMSRHMGYFGKCIAEEMIGPNMSNAVLTLKRSFSKDRRNLIIKGTLTANSGERIRHELIRLTLNEKRVMTVETNKNGVFKLPLSLARFKGSKLIVLAQTAQNELANPPVLKISLRS